MTHSHDTTAEGQSDRWAPFAWIAYLLPILLLFGFGPVVGLIASVLFAFPPMVRNTILGLRQVSPEIIESGLMSGATPGQLFWQVRIPAASRQLLRLPRSSISARFMWAAMAWSVLTRK